MTLSPKRARFALLGLILVVPGVLFALVGWGPSRGALQRDRQRWR